MKITKMLLSVILLFFVSGTIYSQSDDLKLFGYFQNNFTHWEVTSEGSNQGINTNTFLMQQLNVMLSKNLSQEFTSFVNLEFTNSFSSSDSIGNFKVEEAWLKYSPVDMVNIKGGLLVPRFNNFNEIKNRTVLLPYIHRPLAYETVFFKQFNTSELVPVSANLQVYGDVPVNNFYVNYAFFAGNSETSMLVKNSADFGPGEDETKYKMFGGRLGLEYGDLSFGVSGTLDWKDIRNYSIGYQQRKRLGAYINYSLAGFDLEAEYIGVFFNLSDADNAILDAQRNAAPTTTGMFIALKTPENFNKTFYHTNLLYNITEQLAAYAGYDYLEGADNIFISGGLGQYTTGCAYSVTSSILLKAQYTLQKFNMMGTSGSRVSYLAGASVSF